MEVDELVSFLLTPVAQIGLIIGLSELFKKAGVEVKFIPLVDVGLGLISGIGIYGIGLNYGVIKGILIGLAMGLNACGLFSGIKNLVN